eukprot:UN04407
MRVACDDHAKKFVEEDDFFHDVPATEVEELKNKLAPEFEKAYEEKYNDKIDELIKSLTNTAMTEKPNIVLASKSPKDRVERMYKTVDAAANDFVEKDDFFKQVPMEEVQALKENWRLNLNKHNR